MRRKARVDANQPKIVAALRQVGVTVELLFRVGGGCPDIVVGYSDRNTGEPRSLLVEIKGPKGKLTPAEEKWFANWGGAAIVARNVDDILVAIGYCNAHS